MKRFCASILGLLLLSAPAFGAECFASSKIYSIHPLHGGAEKRDSWAVQGDSFAQCVHRGEAAEKSFRARYPDAVFQLSLASTIGCHSPC
jgi:hypothetical protein